VGRAAEFLEGLDERYGAASGTLSNWWVRDGWHYETHGIDTH
jgi:hypothetical protein